MPRAKISISDISVEDAFAVLRRHGLNVRVESTQKEDPGKADIADFLQPDKVDAPPPVKTASKGRVHITLYTQHTIACSGGFVGSGADKHVEGAAVATYGPGVVAVPAHLAAQLLHQDGLAKQAENDLLDPRVRSRLVVPYGSSSRLVDLGFGAANLSNMLNGSNRENEFTF